MNEHEYQYDVCVSYASEDVELVAAVVDALELRGLRTFFDRHQSSETWGAILSDYLPRIFSSGAKYCLVFWSEPYSKKRWPRIELMAASGRMPEEYILPIRVDRTDLPDILEQTGFIVASEYSPQEIADLVAEKCGEAVRKNYMPPNLDLLYQAMNVKDSGEQECVDSIARNFYRILERLSNEERYIVTRILYYGCPGDLPGNVHIDSTHFSKWCSVDMATVFYTITGVRFMGFGIDLEEYGEDETNPITGEPMPARINIELSWLDLSNFSEIAALTVAFYMIRIATTGYCEQHGLMHLDRLDFSQLSSATFTREDDHDKGNAPLLTN